MHCSVVRRLLSDDGALDLQHLRRFVRYEDIPQLVRDCVSSTAQPKLGPYKELLLLVGPVESISKTSLVEALSSTVEPLITFSTPVPLLAPTSQEQAELWTSQCWPTIYNKNNPFGPHPTTLARAEAEISGDVEKWMDLASAAARDASATKAGEKIGAVIIARRNGIARPIAIAGDARWLHWPRIPPGNVTAHAALRAIAMVAEQLRRQDEIQEVSKARESIDSGIFHDQPHSQIEECQGSANVDGYLCHALEIYCTHEPCVMCAMAIMHSRFSRVVFQHRMSHTGGLCADGELGHGLFWRKELNWTLLAWHYPQINDDSHSKQCEDSNLHA